MSCLTVASRRHSVWHSSRVPPLAAGVEFLDEPLAVFGLLLMAGALVSGLAGRSFLSLAAGFVIAGFVLGERTASRSSSSTPRPSSCRGSRSSR